MKSVLIPVDFPFESDNVIDYAIQFFKREECNFYILNTYTYKIKGLDAIGLLQIEDDYYEKPKQQSLDSLNTLINKCKLNRLSVKHYFHAISACCDIIDGIKRMVSKYDIDLVLVPGKSKNELNPCQYSKNIIKIIDQVRECPVMLIPEFAPLPKNVEFILASSFEAPIPKSELYTWYRLMKITKGKVRVVVTNRLHQITSIQNVNLSHTLNRIYNLSSCFPQVDYLKTKEEILVLKQNKADNIIAFVDRKPNMWRKLGFKNSEIIELGPFDYTPLLALHS